MFGKTQIFTIEEKTEVKNNLGEAIETWSEKGTVEGVMWQLSGEEKYTSKDDDSVVEYRLAFDKTFEVTNSDRVSYNGKVYDIELVDDVNNLGKRYELDLKLVPQ